MLVLFYPIKTFFDNTYNNSIHFSLSLIRNWDQQTRFFLNFVVLRSFDYKNKNRLQNIFRKFVKIERIWLELQKMMDVGFIDFSHDSIYLGKNSFNILSIFLFEIYLYEFDYYIQYFSFKSNLRKHFYKIKDSYFFDFLNKDHISIKLEKFLNVSSTLKILNIKNLDNFQLYYRNKLNKCIIFDRFIQWIRYKDYFLFGVVGSKNFLFFLKKKLFSFITGALHFQVKSNHFYDCKESYVFFAGFIIKYLSVHHNYSLSKLKLNKKYFARIFFRLELLNIKISKNFLKRFNMELIMQIEKVFMDKKLNIRTLKDRKLWIYIFQLESIRSTQFNKLLTSKDNFSLITKELFSSIKSFKDRIYKKYLFTLFVDKLQLALHQVISKFPSFISFSILPFDISLNSLFLEFRKKLFFLYSNFYVQSNYIYTESFFSKFYAKKFGIIFSNYNVSFSNSDSRLLKNFYFKNKFSNSFNKPIFFEIFLPVDYCFDKLRQLGFIHRSKNRPISNSRYLFLEDLEIIKQYTYISYIFLNWFRCASNISKLKNVVNLIRQSCFLTLCRKHNKNKTWAYNIYTSDLLIVGNFSVLRCFFPTRLHLFNIKRKFFFSRSEIFFDEQFFL
uniref:putative group II intron reverse transcriptase/maturase mat2 n=1 Tax=Euglena deses TaxID=66845 RepID=UPI0023AB2A11|nr:putative group II intron reverse transcriptase/maturase mat2 [Euglena deses]WCH63394.1 putative group II intron reverse transcriptase/maturase mat2 [Euglena deses]